MTLILGAPLTLARQPQQQRQSSVQEKLPLEEDTFSAVYCTMFLFLLGCFVFGIIMAVFGVLSMPSCQASTIPVWLTVQGVTICILFIILFCGDTNTYFQGGFVTFVNVCPISQCSGSHVNVGFNIFLPRHLVVNWDCLVPW